MIFRWLYERRLTRVFGRFIPEHTSKDLRFSEWESFKLLLPSAIRRLFFPPDRSEIDALRMLQKIMVNAPRDAPHVARTSMALAIGRRTVKRETE
jgi:hypothetical protein